jgi:hypothetical protein
VNASAAARKGTNVARDRGARKGGALEREQEEGDTIQEWEQEPQQGALSKRGSNVQEVGWGERVGSWEDGKHGGRGD